MEFDSQPVNSIRMGAIDLLAGSLGGAACVYVSQPLDTVKVKMQSFPTLYKNMVGCFVETFRKDGVFRGLYAGTVPAVAANVAENSVLFAAYGGCQKFVAYLSGKSSPKNLTVLENAFSGFLAAFFSTFALCPTELIKCRLQALRETGAVESVKNPKNAITPLKLTRQILKSEGIPGLFRGLTPTFVREMPGYFFFFGGYEGARELLRKPNQTKDEIGPLKTMLAGAVGGVTLWTVIFPADVIKSRVQVNGLKVPMIAMGMDIARKEGILALYNGLVPTVCRTIPATATLFVVYEYSKKFMDDFFP
ncbi:unnamed protein product [Hermetia illucens]|uniref:Mitochondrial ornithine transporter 1 n=1 Tax=Hermetia illucens TaxID=343691 RepID=A0A7R8UZA8_HERIL|nr:mitochondrial ornithine transporter 2 [Hermetia illucens]CAD7089812.1 unnamed protein product [Hermetia illucens]